MRRKTRCNITILTTIQQHQQLANTNAQEDALQLVNLATHQHELSIEGTRQLLVALSNMPAVREGDSSACSALFADLLEKYPIYANIGVATRDGEVFCSGMPPSGRVSIADRTYFRLAIETGDFSIGEYQIGRITGKATVNFGYPVRDVSRQVKSVVFAALDLAWLNKLAESAQLPRDSTLTVIDRNGLVLARHPEPEKWIGKTVQEAPVMEAILAKQGEGLAEVPGLDGTPRIYAFTTLSGGQPGTVYLSVGIPKQIVFTEADRILRRNLALLTIVATLTLAAAWLGSELFVLEPVRRLINAAKRLAAGDLSARTELPYEAGELGQLARNFDEMTETIQRRDNELRRANRALKTLSEGNRVLVRAEKESDLLNDVCRNIVEHGGYRLAWVGFAEHDESKTVRPVAQAGYEEGYLDTLNITWADAERGRGPIGASIRGGKPIIARNIQTDSNFEPWRAEATKRGYASMIALPLIAAGQTLGTLNIYAAEPDAFDEEEVKLLTELADDLAFGITSLRTRIERKRAEEELLRKKSELQRAYEELKVIDRVKSDIISNVSHELITPLTIAKNSIELAKEEKNKEERDEILSLGRNALLRQNEIIKNLITLAQSKRGEYKLNVENIDLSQIIELVRNTIEPRAYDKGIKVEILFTDSPIVRADYNGLNHVLYNLLDNAVKFNRENGKVLIGAKRKDNMVEICVADTGIGIPEERLPHLFQPLYQIEMSTTRTYGGTGAGLAVVKQLVEAMGGSVSVESEVNKGSRFCVALPAGSI